MLSLLALGLVSFAGLSVGETVDPKIVGGTTISISQAPYQVSIRRISDDNIRFGMGFFCGGSLISKHVVLTAAHCFYENGKLLSASQLQVVGGHTDLTINNNDTFVSAVSSFKVHESYKDGVSFSNDIAVIKLKTNATTSTSLMPINLPTSTYPAGSSCFITGWGTTAFEGATSDILKGATVPVHNASECNRAFYLNGAVQSGMFCAGPFSGGTDACQGDSGGPLACGMTIYGITSHGNECALPRFPGIYTDVYYYREWILKNGASSNFKISSKILFSTVILVALSYFSL